MVFQLPPARLLLAACVSLSSLTACGASVQAEANAKASTDKSEANFDVESSAWVKDADSEEPSSRPAQSDGATAIESGQSSSQPPALLGARHDLSLAQVQSERCKCLAVVLGGAQSAGLRWAGAVPSVDNSQQLVIGLGSESLSCAGSSTASYMGYEVAGKDVIVTVESAQPGRPVTHGAIIPRPSPGGQVYVQPAPSSPHGRGPSGEPRCALGRGE